MFSQYLNKCHHNIKFTMETETDGKLPFLDVLLSKQRSSNNECATFLVQRISFWILSNHALYINLLVRAVVLATLVKPTGISTHVYINEHLFQDENSHIFKHLTFSKNCQDNCDISCFKIIDNATSFLSTQNQGEFPY